MAKENKKHRETSRREYMDSVRQLAEFVKKLDKRSTAIDKAAREKQQANRNSYRKF